MGIVTLIVAGTMATVFLVGAFWNALLKFLNGWLRYTLEGLLGVENTEWYVSFVKWLDNQVTSKRATVLSWIKRFKENVFSVKESYTPSTIGGFFLHKRETIIRTGATKGIRKVTSETVPDYDLPPNILNELERQNANGISMDTKNDIILKKANEKVLTLEEHN